MKLSDSAQAALNKVLESTANTLADAMDSSGKVVKENVKELAHEVIVFKGYINYATEAIMALIGMSVCIKFVTIFYSKISPPCVENAERYCRETGEGYWFGVTIFALIGLGFGCWFVGSITEGLKAKYAPRLFLTEYATRLLRKEDSK